MRSPALNTLCKMSMEALRRRYPNLPEGYLPRPKFNDRTANGLTKCILAFIRLNGGQCERISCTGRPVDNRKSFTDVVGIRRTIGTISWIPGTMQKGTADISATIKGRSVKIEVKAGEDRQRPDQVRYQRQVEAAGGIYFIAETFDQFFQWFNETFRP